MVLTHANVSQLHHALATFPASFMEPLCVGDPPLHKVRPSLAIATATLLKLDSRHLAVTCHHVLDAYRALAGQPRYFQIGGLPIDPEAQLHAASKRLDIVLFAIAADQLIEEDTDRPGLRRIKFFGPRTWPPTPSTTDDVVSFSGFPGVWREQAGITSLVTFMFAHGAARVASVAHDRLVTRLELSDCELLHREKEVTDLGGLSGGPVFRWRSGDVEPQLVGIVYEHEPVNDLLFIRSTSVILSDGTIDTSVP